MENTVYQSLPQMFLSRARTVVGKAAQRAKKGGGWVDISWKEMETIVREIAYGLLSIGLKKAEAVSLLSASRAEWVHCDLGIQCGGGIVIPIYPSNTADQAEYIVNNSDSKYLIVENKAQLDKMLSVRGKMPNIRAIIVMDGAPAGMEGVLTLDDLMRKGRGKAGDYQRVVEDTVSRISRDDVATIVYTSGTTGPPKGVVQTQGNHLSMAEMNSEILPVTSADVDLLFLPLAHSFARAIEYVDIYNGATTAFAESIEKVVDNMGEVRPDYMASVPRVYEKAYSAILANAQSGPPLKRKIFDWALKTGREVSRLLQAKKPIPLGLRIKRALAHALVFSKLHARFGGRLRYFISGGAPLSKEIAEFFHAAGILILEGYGLTETCPATNINRPDNYKFGTVGLPYPRVEVKIASDGEIVVRGPNIASRGYFKRPDDTRESFTEEGWFRTGDIGEIDADGFLKITDRKKDLIKTSGGKFVAPQNIENMLKVDPFISQAVVIGDLRPYCIALISVNQIEAEKFLKARGISGSTYADLAKNPAVFQRVMEAVNAVNARLASFESIKKVALVPRDFSQETGELTPTLKVKRKVVAELYKDAIEGLYSK